MNPVRDSLRLSSGSRCFSEGDVVPRACCCWVFVSRHGLSGRRPCAPHPRPDRVLAACAGHRRTAEHPSLFTASEGVPKAAPPATVRLQSSLALELSGQRLPGGGRGIRGGRAVVGVAPRETVLPVVARPGRVSW